MGGKRVSNFIQNKKDLSYKTFLLCLKKNIDDCIIANGISDWLCKDYS